jgi:hypothetical protein
MNEARSLLVIIIYELCAHACVNFTDVNRDGAKLMGVAGLLRMCIKSQAKTTINAIKLSRY